MSSPSLTDEPSTSAIDAPSRPPLTAADDDEDGEIYMIVNLGPAKKPCYMYDSLMPFLFAGRRMARRPMSPNANASYAFDAADALYDEEIVRRLSAVAGGTSSSAVESCTLPPHPTTAGIIQYRIVADKKRSSSKNPLVTSAAVNRGSTSNNSNSAFTTTASTSSRASRIRRRVARIVQACLAPFKSTSNNEVAVPFRLLRNREGHTNSGVLSSS